MFRPALRIAPHARSSLRLYSARRVISTAPPHQKSRSWKNSAARWGLAGALIYAYNTASVFAEEPAYAISADRQKPQEPEDYPTVASISEQSRAQARLREPPASISPQTSTYTVADAEQPAAGSPEELEAEASEQGAFNEETGEINWDCPCLGGMAYGPCGEQFRAAFSCFVFSQEEPKGVDCIEHFKAMQNCFREHPDVYGGELDDDEALPEGEIEQAGTISPEPTPAPQAAKVQISDVDQRAPGESQERTTKAGPALPGQSENHAATAVESR